MPLTNPITVDEYIAGFPEVIQILLQQVRAAIQTASPRAKEAIKYGIPTFVFHGNLVHFGGYKHHIGFYPGPDAITAFESELAAYKSSKGAVQFPVNKPMPVSLIKKIVRYNIRLTASTAAKKK